MVSVSLGVVWLVTYVRARRFDSPDRLLSRLPSQDAVLLFVDFGALRQAGTLDLLNQSRASQEQEYQSFVTATSFDYLRDLDMGMASFQPTGVSFVARGRFDWPRLSAYAAAQGGRCQNAVCRMQGSTPDRQISFQPLRQDTMALAVSKDDWAVAALNRHWPPPPGFRMPALPVWIYLPPRVFRDNEPFPPGTRLFGRALASAEGVILGLGREGDRLEVRLDVSCRTAEDATLLARQLETVTGELKRLIEEQHQQPKPGGLSAALVAGTFRAETTRVTGRWPVDRGFLEALAKGEMRTY